MMATIAEPSTAPKLLAVANSKMQSACNAINSITFGEFMLKNH